MKPVVALVDWFGPYTLKEAQAASRGYFDDGLYVVIGKARHNKVTHVQYIGLASGLQARLVGVHGTLPRVTRGQMLWLGEVVSPRTPGRKIKVTDRMLDLTEWAHAYFLQLPLNKQKKAMPPDRPIIVYNKWWRPELDGLLEQRKKRPHKEWPDVIEFTGSGYPVKLVWFGGRQIVREAGEFRA